MRPSGNTTLTTRATQAKRAASLNKLWFIHPPPLFGIPIFLGDRDRRGGDAWGILYTKPQRIQACCQEIPAPPDLCAALVNRSVRTRPGVDGDVSAAPEGPARRAAQPTAGVSVPVGLRQRSSA